MPVRKIRSTADENCSTRVCTGGRDRVGVAEIASRLGAEELLAMVELSLRHHLEAGTILQGRELPSALAAACKALEGAMNIEATALGISTLLEEL